MNLNRIELKKIMYDYNCISNRLLQANFEDYNSVLKKFLNFIAKFMKNVVTRSLNLA